MSLRPDLPACRYRLIYMSFCSEESILTVRNNPSVIELHVTGNNILSAESGTTYVRWGQTVCPGDSETIYTGIDTYTSHYEKKVSLFCPSQIYLI